MFKNRHRLYSGGLMILIGLAAVAGSFEYKIGTLARMGPGYFPLLLGLTLVLLGVLIFVSPNSAMEEMAEAEREPLLLVIHKHARPWLAVVIGMIAFIVIGKWGGLVPATFMLVFVSALGDRANSLVVSFLLALGVVVFAVVVFHYGMGMQFPLFTWG